MRGTDRGETEALTSSGEALDWKCDETHHACTDAPVPGSPACHAHGRVSVLLYVPVPGSLSPSVARSTALNIRATMCHTRGRSPAGVFALGTGQPAGRECCTDAGQ